MLCILYSVVCKNLLDKCAFTNSAASIDRSISGIFRRLSVRFDLFQAVCGPELFRPYKKFNLVQQGNHILLIALTFLR